MYLNTITGEFPRYDGDLELLGWTVGDPLPENWVKVEYVDPPIIKEGETYTQLPPTLQGGIWKINWEVRQITEEERKIQQTLSIREKIIRHKPITAEEALLLVSE